VRCAAWKDGMGASLRAGLAAAAGLPVDAALVCPCDLPRLEAPQVEALVAAWRADPARPAACRYAGVVGTPAIIPRAAFDAAAAEGGDHGARGWLRRQPVLSLVDAPGLAFDVDERGDLPQPR
jgi:CTP:molybdopterin cytidylyltransferase MocA